ncbi:MAG: hypothetical protein CVU64_15485 [Deltaproteobacteria bacterium HGW-Deltaproteobacteria-21]|nr:MAG: hypothetical protein CVU64_15485 [Deltaproteobacteria bacterium HGW-Deltaproteobacteria-21]
MSRRAKQIGFSQRVRLEWVEQTAELVMAGNDQAAINVALQDLLKDKVSIGGEAVRGNREKIITILFKMWVAVPRGLEELRADGLEILRRLPRKDRIAVHWGMALAAYPFWGAVASQTGRLLRLQATASASQVQRRVREQYGERETVSRAARRVLRSFMDWRVLSETGQKGVYRQGEILPIKDSKLIAWLVEASLHARENMSGAIRDLLDSPSLFPFRLSQIPADRLIAKSARLELLRHGMDENLIKLREQKSWR